MKTTKSRTEPSITKRKPVSLVLPPEGIVRLPTVLAVTGLSKSTWWRGVAAGRYPRGIKIGLYSTGWSARDIRDLIEHGIAAPQESRTSR